MSINKLLIEIKQPRVDKNTIITAKIIAECSSADIKNGNISINFNPELLRLIEATSTNFDINKNVQTFPTGIVPIEFINKQLKKIPLKIAILTLKFEAIGENGNLCSLNAIIDKVFYNSGQSDNNISASSQIIIKPISSINSKAGNIIVLNDAYTDKYYQYFLNISGGVKPYNFSPSKLPEGLVISPSGVISGWSAQVGKFNFDLIVNDSDLPASSLTIKSELVIKEGPLSICPVENKKLTASQEYSCSLVARGGTPPYSWTVKSGEISGFAISSGGVFSGKTKKAGKYNILFEVQDSLKKTAELSQDFEVKTFNEAKTLFQANDTTSILAIPSILPQLYNIKIETDFNGQNISEVVINININGKTVRAATIKEGVFTISTGLVSGPCSFELEIPKTLNKFSSILLKNITIELANNLNPDIKPVCLSYERLDIKNKKIIYKFMSPGEKTTNNIVITGDTDSFVISTKNSVQIRNKSGKLEHIITTPTLRNLIWASKGFSKNHVFFGIKSDNTGLVCLEQLDNGNFSVKTINLNEIISGIDAVAINGKFYPVVATKQGIQILADNGSVLWGSYKTEGASGNEENTHISVNYANLKTSVAVTNRFGNSIAIFSDIENAKQPNFKSISVEAQPVSLNYGDFYDDNSSMIAVEHSACNNIILYGIEKNGTLTEARCLETGGTPIDIMSMKLWNEGLPFIFSADSSSNTMSLFAPAIKKSIVFSKSAETKNKTTELKGKIVIEKPKPPKPKEVTFISYDAEYYKTAEIPAKICCSRSTYGEISINVLGKLKGEVSSFKTQEAHPYCLVKPPSNNNSVIKPSEVWTSSTALIGNIGNADLSVKNISTGGKNSSLFKIKDLTEFPFVISPQNLQEVEIDFSSTKTGIYSCYLEVITNDPLYPKIYLPLSVQVS